MTEETPQDIVTLVPRFVITPGEPPVREASNPGDNEPSDEQGESVSEASDTTDTLLPMDVEPYNADRPLPARSMLRRMPTKVL